MWNRVPLPGSSWRKIRAIGTLENPKDKKRRANLRNSTHRRRCEFYAERSDSMGLRHLIGFARLEKMLL